MKYLKLDIGKINNLVIFDINERGALLKNDGSDRGVILPIEELPNDKSIGESIDVFIYKDSKGRLAATIRKPYGQVGEIAYLKVVDITPIGGFLDWGLEKDLFIPMREQICKIIEGKYYLVKIYLDKSQRLCATMRIDDDLKTHPPYKTGDVVEGTVYGYNPRLGVFIAIDNQYYGFVHKTELFNKLTIGDRSSFRVIRIREDGRVDLSTRQVAHKQMNDDAENILQLLAIRRGFLPLNDKSDPEEIKRYLSISKNAFKRALGKLLKEKKVMQTEEGIKLLVDVKVKDLEEDEDEAF